MQERVLVIQEDLVMRKIMERMFLQKGYNCFCLASLMDFKPMEMDPQFAIVVTDLIFHGIRPEEYVLNLKDAIKYDKLFIVTMLGQDKVKRSILRLTEINGYFDYPVDLKKIEDQI